MRESVPPIRPPEDQTATDAILDLVLSQASFFNFFALIKVYVYSTNGALLGSWTVGTMTGAAQPEGITTNGTDVWIVDNKTDKVFKYAGAASRLTGSQTAASSFSLNGSNSNGKGIVTDGASLWVVDDGSSDKVYKYSLSGTAIGSWTMNGGGGSPTGITLNPASPSSLWIVDNASDKVYEYTAAVGVISGSLFASTSFALAAGNTNPQDIADPPAGGSVPIVTSAMAPMAPRMSSKAIDSALTQLSDDFVRCRVGSTFEIDRSDSEQSLAPPLSSNSLVQFPTQQSTQPSMSENRATSQSKRLAGPTNRPEGLRAVAS